MLAQPALTKAGKLRPHLNTQGTVNMTKATAVWTPGRQPSLLLLSLALLTTASLASAQVPSPKAVAPRYDSIWRLVLNWPELAPLAMTISQFPDLLLLLSDPNLVVTIFLPRDMSFSTMQTPLQHEPAGQPPSAAY